MNIVLKFVYFTIFDTLLKNGIICANLKGEYL